MGVTPTVRGRQAQTQAQARAHETAEQARRSPWIARLGRAGYVAMGVSYASVAILALEVALGRRSGPSDRQGALHAVAARPFGKLLLVLLAIGFAAFALWRLVSAVVDRQREGAEPKGLAKRAGALGQAVVYAALCVTAVSIVLGSGGGGGSASNEKGATASALSMPGGRLLVGAIGLGFLAAGVVNLWRAVQRSFLDDLRLVGLSRGGRQGVTAVGVAGFAARGVVFGLIGIFVAKAAWDYKPREAIGLDGALAKLAHQAYGPWLLGAVAVGLLAYGAFCLVQARYSDV